MAKRVIMGVAMKECLIHILSIPHPISVGEIARAASRKRAQRAPTYRAVGRLASMGMVRWIEGRPRLVEPTVRGQKWHELVEEIGSERTMGEHKASR